MCIGKQNEICKRFHSKKKNWYTQGNLEYVAMGLFSDKIIFS